MQSIQQQNNLKQPVNTTQLLMGDLINEEINISMISEQTGIAMNCLRRYAEGKVPACQEHYHKMLQLWASTQITANHENKQGA